MSVWFLSLSCAMISCYNVSKLPICEEGKQRSPWGAEVDFPSFPSGATFSVGLWYIQEPGSGSTRGSLQPHWWDACSPCPLPHCHCAVVSLGSCCPPWDLALPQRGWVPLESEAWGKGSMTKPRLQEAGGHERQGAGAGMEGLWQANCSGNLLCPFFLPQDLGLLLCSGAPLQESGHSGRRRGSRVLPYSRDPRRTHSSPSWA